MSLRGSETVVNPITEQKYSEFSSDLNRDWLQLFSDTQSVNQLCMETMLVNHIPESYDVTVCLLLSDLKLPYCKFWNLTEVVLFTNSIF